MPLLNYTTKVNVYTTLGEIQGQLVKHGAKKIMQDYDDDGHIIHSPENEYDTPHSAREHFVEIWDSTIRPGIRSLYGWGGNPWVWVIEFERISREEL